MEQRKTKNIFKQNPDEQYEGNVFGWKVSIIGLACILLFVGLYFWARNYNQEHDIPIKKVEDVGPSPYHKKDTIKN